MRNRRTQIDEKKHDTTSVANMMSHQSHRSEIKHESGVITLPISSIRPFIDLGSDKRYTELFEAGIRPADEWMTIVRWFGVIDNYLYDSTTNGLALNFMSSGTPAGNAARAILLTFCGIAGLANMALQRHEHNKAHKESKEAIKNLYRLMQPTDPNAPESKETMQQRFIQLIRDNIAEFNQYLEKIRLENEEFREKYESIAVDVDDLEQLTDEDFTSGRELIRMKFKFKDASAKKKKEAASANRAQVEQKPQPKTFLEKVKSFATEVKDKVLVPTWDFVMQSAFAFWIAWIVAALFTGQLEEAIFKLPTQIALALTGGTAIAPFCIRVYNYFKYGHGSWKEFNENARKTQEAKADMDKLVIEAQKSLQYDKDLALAKAQESELEAQLAARGLSTYAVRKAGSKQQVKAPTNWWDSPHLQAATTLVSSTAKYFGGSHYAAWWAKVALVCFGVGITMATWNPIAGGILIGIGVCAGVYEAVNRYRESKKLRDQLKQNPPNQSKTLEELENIHKQRTAYLNSLKKDIARYQTIPNIAHKHPVPASLQLTKPPQSRWEKFKSGFFKYGQKISKSPLLLIYDLLMCGFFVARLLFKPLLAKTSAAIFLPFVALSFASNPVTLSVMIALSLLFVGLKYYEHTQKEKEKKIKEMPGKLEETEKLIELAERINHSQRLTNWMTAESNQERARIAREHGMANEFKPDPVLNTPEIANIPVQTSVATKAKATMADPFEALSDNNWGVEKANQAPAASTQTTHFFKPSDGIESKTAPKSIPAVKEDLTKNEKEKNANWGPDTMTLNPEPAAAPVAVPVTHFFKSCAMESKAAEKRARSVNESSFKEDYFEKVDKSKNANWGPDTSMDTRDGSYSEFDTWRLNQPVFVR